MGNETNIARNSSDINHLLKSSEKQDIRIDKLTDNVGKLHIMVEGFIVEMRSDRKNDKEKKHTDIKEKKEDKEDLEEYKKTTSKKIKSSTDLNRWVFRLVLGTIIVCFIKYVYQFV